MCEQQELFQLLAPGRCSLDGLSESHPMHTYVSIHPMTGKCTLPRFLEAVSLLSSLSSGLLPYTFQSSLSSSVQQDFHLHLGFSSVFWVPETYPRQKANASVKLVWFATLLLVTFPPESQYFSASCPVSEKSFLCFVQVFRCLWYRYWTFFTSELWTKILLLLLSSRLHIHHGPWTHDPLIKSPIFYQLSQLGAPGQTFWWNEQASHVDKV